MKTIIIIEHHPDLTSTPIDDKWWLIRWPSTEAQAQADLETLMANIAKEQQS